MNISQEYIAAVVVIVVSGLHAFGVEVASTLVEAVVTGAAALWIIFRKVQKGDITPLGVRK